ncbi:MAG: SDR family NAD(P)-dependent oxidoreductase, partial [bacterium]|nr:SDR family NAD(P)-dependent oxidoreductase [bacterium]
MGYFSGKVIFLTGASSGIGAELAKGLASQGARLVLLARRIDRLESLAQELKSDGVDIMVAACDVTKEGDLKKAVQETLDKFGRIDVVVANAGFGVVAPIKKLTLEDYRRQFET